MGGMSTEPFKLDFVALLVDGIQRDVTIIGEYYEVTYSSDATERELARQLHAAGATDAPFEEQIRALLARPNPAAPDEERQHATWWRSKLANAEKTLGVIADTVGAPRASDYSDLPDAVRSYIAPMLSAFAAMQQAGAEMPSAIDVRRAIMSALLEHADCCNGQSRAQIAALAILDLFAPHFARLTQEQNEVRETLAAVQNDRATYKRALDDAQRENAALRQRAERAERELGMSRKPAQQEQPAPGVFEVQRIYEMAQHPALASEITALRQRAERAERERDEARITKQKVDEHVNAAAEVVRLRARVAELESRPEPGADVVANLRQGFVDAWGKHFREHGATDLAELEGIRAVLSALASMGEEAWPSDAAILEQAWPLVDHGAVTLECAVIDVLRSRLAPVIGVQKATSAEQAKRIAELEAAARLVVVHHEASKSREAHPLERGDAMRDRGFAIDAMGALLRKGAP